MASAPINLSGRPRSFTPIVKWKVTVPADVALLIEEALPGRSGKPKYGARAELIEQLLRRWLRENDIRFEEATASSSERPEGEDSPSHPLPAPIPEGSSS